jgi:TPR repeat protein
MARFEMAGLESAVLGQAPATADSFYQLGIKYSVGADVAADLVSAHKWFNLAAMKGNKDAIQLRQEIAAGMSPAEIAAAQRAARAWLMTTH